MAQDDQDDEEIDPAVVDELARQFASEYMERELHQRSHPTTYVAFMDMLGFSDLVKEFPGSLSITVLEDDVLAGTSKSSERFGRFHYILDAMAMNQLDTDRPERMMIFSDCAFAVYDSAQQGAISLRKAMQAFLKSEIPVRMALAKGTCHAERFSIESFSHFHMTRSMFYGSGVVHAVEGEKGSGRGCRIFLHKSLNSEDIQNIQLHHPVIKLENPTESPFELNYLHMGVPVGGPDPDQSDMRIYDSFRLLHGQLPADARSEVVDQYNQSFLAFNAMRKQHNRPQVWPPHMTPPAGL